MIAPRTQNRDQSGSLKTYRVKILTGRPEAGFLLTIPEKAFCRKIWVVKNAFINLKDRKCTYRSSKTPQGDVLEIVMHIESLPTKWPVVYQTIVLAPDQKIAIGLGADQFWEDELTHPFWPRIKTTDLTRVIKRLRTKSGYVRLPEGFYAIATEVEAHDLLPARSFIAQSKARSYRP